MKNRMIVKAVAIAILSVLVISQSGCSLAARLKQPLEDFSSATRVVSATARLGYEKIKQSAFDEALRKAQCAPERVNVTCKPSRIDINKLNAERVYTADGMRARLDALESLEKYVTLLSELVDSNKPEKITQAADKLARSIDKLAAQITELNKPNGTGDGSADPVESPAEKVRKEKFLATVGIFSTAMSVILSAIGNRRRDNALKKAVIDANPAVKDIIEGLKTDFNIFWSNEARDANTEIVKAFAALNTEIAAKAETVGSREDTGLLRGLRNDVIDAVNTRDTVLATNPREALEKMAKAHDVLVACATQPTSENFRASVEAIQLYVAAATRLGGAIVKLNRIKPEEGPR